MKTFYLVRGCSGSGKSSFASTLSEFLPKSYWAETDKLLHDEDGTYRWTEQRVCWAHFETARMLDAAFKSGCYDNIILSDTSVRLKDIKAYLEMAETYGYRIVSMVMENRHGSKDLHGLSAEKLKAQRESLLSTIKLTPAK